MIYELKHTESAAPLFEGWQETLIWSCLQGVMGNLYAVLNPNPVSAAAMLGDFCFFAGKPDKELVLHKPEGCTRNFMIMVPQNEDWGEVIEKCFKDRAKKVSRYAFKKEPDSFDENKLQKIAEGLTEEYEMKLMDEALFERCKSLAWCGDFVSNYKDYEAYRKYGLGVMVLRGGEPVSGASSYSGYQGGIEIEIDTKEEYRRRGLAYICGAKLILECRKRGLYPSWDAQNPWSAALAEKLGYHFDHEYTAYEIAEY